MTLPPASEDRTRPHTARGLSKDDAAPASGGGVAGLVPRPHSVALGRFTQSDFLLAETDFGSRAR